MEIFWEKRLFDNADGSEDNKINSKELPDYKVLPSILLDPSTAPVELSSVPGHDNVVEEDVFDDFDGDDEMDNKEIVEDDGLSYDGRKFHLFNLWLSF